jgi:hypothetical protein
LLCAAAAAAAAGEGAQGKVFEGLNKHTGDVESYILCFILLLLLMMMPPFAGEGAYGKVFEGLNKHTGELMAVKALQLLGRPDSEAVRNQLQELTQVCG